jgi:hypothetical protein
MYLQVIHQMLLACKYCKQDVLFTYQGMHSCQAAMLLGCRHVGQVLVHT